MNRSANPSYSPSPPDPDENPGHVEDRAWVRLALDGDEGAFERLYQKHRDRVFRVLYGVVRNREDALEGVQDVFVKVYGALDRFDLTGRFVTWISRIARNQGIDLLRRKGVRKEQMYDETFVGVEAPHSAETPVSERLDREDIRRRVATALSGLSEKHIAVFQLYSYEELSYAEISETLGVPIGTVMSRLFYARKKIREQLPPDWDPGGPRRREDRRRG